MVHITMLTDRDAQARRRELLAGLSINEQELRARAERYELDAAQRAVLQQLDEIDFLLNT